MFKFDIKKAIAFLFVFSAAICFLNFSALATGTSSNVSSDPDADVPLVNVSSNPQETLGTVNFSDSNAKRVSVGKSTMLYLTIKDMGYSYYTIFETSDPKIASITQIDNRAVKVVGLKKGIVTITATVDSSKGIKVAKYQLVVGEEEDVPSDVVSEESDVNGGIVTEEENDDIDLFSSTEDPMLIAYAESRNDNNATSILLGLIGWVLIIVAVFYVFSVIIRNRTPKLNVSPGSRRRYSAGGAGSSRSRSRLLPDKYYRNLKKY